MSVKPLTHRDREQTAPPVLPGATQPHKEVLCRATTHGTLVAAAVRPRDPSHVKAGKGEHSPRQTQSLALNQLRRLEITSASSLSVALSIFVHNTLSIFALLKPRTTAALS